MTSPTDKTRSSKDTQTTGRTVVGLFKDRSEAQDAIRDLKNAGYTSEQIGIATLDRNKRGEARTERGEARAEGADPEELGKIVQETATGMAEGATVGALTGGVVGGLVGLISSLLIPGLGPLVVGGVLASTLLGMGVGAATGGLIGALVGMGVPEEDAKYFDTGLRDGGTLVTVTAPDGAPEAILILERRGGDLGPTKSRSKPPRSYEGQERRCSTDVYAGPERRLVGV